MGNVSFTILVKGGRKMKQTDGRFRFVPVAAVHPDCDKTAKTVNPALLMS
jgi:hypothetical protein